MSSLPQTLAEQMEDIAEKLNDAQQKHSDLQRDIAIAAQRVSFYSRRLKRLEEERLRAEHGPALPDSQGFETDEDSYGGARR